MEPARAPQCPPLPPELWIRILTFNPDLTHLWTSCRHVSRDFSAYTEQIFAHTVIRNTHIDFQLEKYNLGGTSKRPHIPTTFARFEPSTGQDGGDAQDKARAWFDDKRRKKDIGGGKKAEYDRLMSRWESNVHNRQAQMPYYTIRIDHMVNDTELPGLTIDLANRRVGFDWRRAFTLFFREQALFQKLERDCRVADDKAINEVMAERILPMSTFPESWETVTFGLRKQIRRKRLAEHYAADAKMVWAINSLKYLQDHGATAHTVKALKLDPHLPGTGLGERWFGSMGVVQELYLDEWSCMHRIATNEYFDAHLRNSKHCSISYTCSHIPMMYTSYACYGVE